MANNNNQQDAAAQMAGGRSAHPTMEAVRQRRPHHEHHHREHHVHRRHRRPSSSTSGNQHPPRRMETMVEAVKKREEDAANVNKPKQQPPQKTEEAIEGRVYTLRTADGVDFPGVGQAVINMMGAVRRLIETQAMLRAVQRAAGSEEQGNPNLLQLEYIDEDSMRRVLAWCQSRKRFPIRSADELRKYRMSPLPDWDAQFLGQLNRTEIIGLLLSANYLDITGLIDVCCRKVAEMLKGKRPEQIRAEFELVDDFTEEDRFMADQEYAALHRLVPEVNVFAAPVGTGRDPEV